MFAGRFNFSNAAIVRGKFISVNPRSSAVALLRFGGRRLRFYFDFRHRQKVANG